MGRVRRATGPTVSFGIHVHRVDLHRAPGRLRGEMGAAPRVSVPMGRGFQTQSITLAQKGKSEPGWKSPWRSVAWLLGHWMEFQEKGDRGWVLCQRHTLHTRNRGQVPYLLIRWKRYFSHRCSATPRAEFLLVTERGLSRPCCETQCRRRCLEHF